MARHTVHLLGVASLMAILACGDTPRDTDDDDGSVGSGTGANAPTATSSGSGAGDQEPAGLTGITAAHNQVRQAVDTGEPLFDLVWSPTVASVAQAYADQLASQGCPLTHSGGAYGENLFWGSAAYTPAEVVGSWASEISRYTHTTFPDACSCTCGHYTQIVWRETREVGCGIGACPDGGEVWVCNYDPPGNYIGEWTY